MIKLLMLIILLINSSVTYAAVNCEAECHRGTPEIPILTPSQQAQIGNWYGNLPMTTVTFTESVWAGVVDWGLMANIKYSIASNQNDFINYLGITPKTYITSVNIAMMSTGLSGLARSQIKKALRTIKTVKFRQTKGGGRLGGNDGGPGVRLEFKDGTYFDMTRQRVKQTELNPYVPGKTRPVIFDKPLNTQGDKRAPTKAELEWFDKVDWKNL